MDGLTIEASRRKVLLWVGEKMQVGAVDDG